MKKGIIAIVVMAVMALSVFAFAGCDNISLDEYKVTGKALIDAHVATKTQSDYSTEKWEELLNVAVEGKQAVEGATNKGAVDTAVSEAKDAIDEVLEEKEMADFVLTISVDNNTKNYGEDFVVEVCLKNQSGEDVEIATGYTYSTIGMGPAVQLFSPQKIDGWMFLSEPSDAMPGEANLEILIDGGQRKTIINLGSFGLDADYNQASLTKGTHDLRFSATFSLNWGTENQQEMVIWSNIIKLTVK